MRIPRNRPVDSADFLTEFITKYGWIYHHDRLERIYSVFLIQVRETQVFVCARATLDRRIALDLKRVVGF